MNPNNCLIASNYPASVSSSSLLQWAEKIVRSSWQVTVSSGSLNGTFTLQVSNDQSSDGQSSQFYPTNWSSLGSVTVVCSTTAPGSGIFLIQGVELCYQYMRLNFTAGNGGNTLGLYSVRQKSMGL